MTKLTDVAEGDWLIADAGFPCLQPDRRYRVYSSDHGLFINCTTGHHYLDGALDLDGELMGLTKVKEE